MNLEEMEKVINELRKLVGSHQYNFNVYRDRATERFKELSELKDRLDAMNIREVIQEEVEQVREVLRGFMDDVRYILDKEIHSHSMDYLNDRVEEHKTKLSGEKEKKEAPFELTEVKYPKRLRESDLEESGGEVSNLKPDVNCAMKEGCSDIRCGDCGENPNNSKTPEPLSNNRIRTKEELERLEGVPFEDDDHPDSKKRWVKWRGSVDSSKQPEPIIRCGIEKLIRHLDDKPREDDVINIREMVKTLTNKEWVLVKREKIEFWRKELLNKTDEVLKSMREVLGIK